MPRDKRLYMTFPIDIHRHPKLQRVSVAARWAFVEMNGEARIAGNDGRFTAEDAEYMWSTDLLNELIESHPARPLINREGTDYVIRDYAEHQMTAADIEDLSEKRARAGRMGAEVTNAKKSASAAAKSGNVSASAGARTASAAASAGAQPASARQNPATGRQNPAESESESESELETELSLMTDTTTSSGQVTKVDARVEDADSFTLELDSAKRRAVLDAEELGIRDLADTRNLIESRLEYAITMGETIQLCRWIISKATNQVADGGAYVGTVVRKSPARVREMAEHLGLGVAA